MKFYVSRAMQVARLNVSQLHNLQQREKEIGRCMGAFEICTRFNLPPANVIWKVPSGSTMSISAAQSAHALRVAADISRLGLIEGNGGWIEECGNGPGDWPVHKYDWKVFEAVEAKRIDFEFRKAHKKSSLLDEVSDNVSTFDPKLKVI